MTKSEPTPRQAAEQLADDLHPLGNVTTRAMFGGYGLFSDDVMFAIIDSNGTAYLRVDATTRPLYEQAGSTHHGAMPYWQIPTAVRHHPELLVWARTALTIAIDAKRP